MESGRDVNGWCGLFSYKSDKQQIHSSEVVFSPRQNNTISWLYVNYHGG